MRGASIIRPVAALGCERRRASSAGVRGTSRQDRHGTTDESVEGPHRPIFGGRWACHQHITTLVCLNRIHDAGHGLLSTVLHCGSCWRVCNSMYKADVREYATHLAPAVAHQAKYIIIIKSELVTSLTIVYQHHTFVYASVYGAIRYTVTATLWRTYGPYNDAAINCDFLGLESVIAF